MVANRLPAGSFVLDNDLNNAVAGGTVIGRNKRTTNLTTTGAIVRVLSTIATVEVGRMYRVWAQGEADAGTVPATSQPELRYTTNNTEPLTSSPVLARTVIDHRVAGVPDLLHLDALYIPATNHIFRVVLCHQRVVGAGSVSIIASATSACELVVQDAGETVATSGTVY
jgi:hypothetical protein